MDNTPVITVDGPSGVGKGTVCDKLAGRLGWHFLDSGALYRVLAHVALINDVSLDNESALASMAASLDVSFESSHAESAPRIILSGQDVTDAIRTEECGNAASRLATYNKVRKALLERQRAFRRPPGLIADGRDMGTVVFPDAALKLFLTASPEERAKRRYKQLKQKGINASLQHLSGVIAERDSRDKGRSVSPLKAAADAIVIDTTELGVTEVNSKVLELVRMKFPENSGIPSD
ncbi:MAG: (d)CMP kinase [Proteobacteria bacterium]|nr:(d)CMP kinase [Pseudomonadota bacterium]